MTLTFDPPVDIYSSELYRRDVAMLESFLMWANTRGYVICQWQPIGVGEYLKDVTEQAIQALPVMFSNERDSHALNRARTGEAAQVEP